VILSPTHFLLLYPVTLKSLLRLEKKKNNMRMLPGRQQMYSRTKKKKGPGLVVHIYNPSTHEAEAGGSVVQVQPGLQSEALNQNKS
jgi:hypothetical protein